MSPTNLTKQSFCLNRRLKKTTGLPGVILMTDQNRLADPVHAATALPSGSAIILRDYSMDGREALGQDLINVCRRRRLRLLVAGDWRLAQKLGAHGVHLPEWQLLRQLTWQRKPGWLITAAAHSEVALILAARSGVHAALLSPVFETNSHTGGSNLGALRFTRAVKQAPLPIYGLGGINSSNALRLSSSGAAGFAAVSGLAP